MIVNTGMVLDNGLGRVDGDDGREKFRRARLPQE